MSMISVQIDGLRAIADKDTVPYEASDAMYQAADTIWELRDDLQRANAENARLRSELESVGTAAYLYGRNDLKAENAKLWELCVDMMWTIRNAHGYFKDDTHEMLMTYVRGRDGKPTHVSHSLMCDEEEYERRMRELKVEVD